MLTFLNSLILSSLAAAAIPLLIHLFNKQRTKKILFSSLRFLKKLEKQRLKKIKLYQFLLILIRTLIIVFIVLAFARPTLTGNWSVINNASARTTAAIILDDGLNMRQYDIAGNRFNRALIKLKEILKSFNPEDKISIITSSSPQNNILESQDLQRLKCSYRIGDYHGAIIQSKQVFNENPNLNKELHIISDFGTLPESGGELLENLPDVNIFMEKIAQEDEGNISIDSLTILNALLEINKPVNFEVTLRNHSDNMSKSVNIHLFIEKQRVAQSNTVIAPLETKSRQLSFQPKSYGRQAGYIEIEDDDLLADNKYYFSINIPENVKLLFVDSNPSPYLSAAMETINQGANIKINTENYNTLAKQSFFTFDVICLSNLPKLSKSIIDRIASYIKAGGGLIIITGKQTIPSSFNRNLSPILGNIKISNFIELKDEPKFFTFKTLSKNNPFIEGLFRNDKSEISLPRISTYFKFSKPANYQNIILLNSGDPFLLKSSTGQNNILILSSYLDTPWSDLQFKGIFIPLIIRMVKFAAASPAQHGKRIFVGEEVVMNINNFDTQKSYKLIMPNGDKNRITTTFTESSFLFNLKDFHKPGNYKIEENNKIIAIVSTNVESKRNQRSTLDIDELALNNENISIIDEKDNIFNIVKEARFGEELWKYAVIVVILFLLFEGVIVKKIEGKSLKQNK